MKSPDIKAPPASSRMLMRTQSLGSVENYQSPVSPHDNLSGSDGQTTPQEIGFKSKDKQWYETTLDSGPPPPPPPPPGHRIRRVSQHNPSSHPLPPAKERAPPVRSNSIPANRRSREDDRPKAPLPRERYNEAREIPAESNPSSGKFLFHSV